MIQRYYPAFYDLIFPRAALALVQGRRRESDSDITVDGPCLMVTLLCISLLFHDFVERRYSMQTFYT